MTWYNRDTEEFVVGNAHLSSSRAATITSSQVMVEYTNTSLFSVSPRGNDESYKYVNRVIRLM